MELLNFPPGYTLRPATWADLAAVTELVRATDAADDAGPGYTEAEQRGTWTRPNFDLATDAWVVAHAQGLAAYADVWERHPHALYVLDGYVHPAHRGRGVGAAVLQKMEAHVRARCATAAPGGRAQLLHWTAGSDQAAPHLFAQQGFRQARQAWHMRLDMATPPPPPVWPSGITLRPYTGLAEAQAAHLVVQEAFSDLEDFVPTTFADWQQLGQRPDEFDPGLWFLAFAGATPAGVALCLLREGEGWVRQLAVRRPYRQTGLGLALLHQAFGAFYARGVRRVELGVDTANATGATRLYHRAGMQVARHFISYEKFIAFR